MHLRFAWLLLFTILVTPLFAKDKDKDWQDARVVQANGEIPQRGFYWLRANDKTYLIHNYANTNAIMVQWWVRLTLGGTARVYSDGKNLHILDDQNKERKCTILRSMTNAMADDLAARQAKKTPEQLAQEQAVRDAITLQNNEAANALILQRQARSSEQLKEMNRPSPPVQPLPTSRTNVTCVSRTMGDTVYTDCH